MNLRADMLGGNVKVHLIEIIIETRRRLREDKKEIETVCDTKLNAAEQKLVVE